MTTDDRARDAALATELGWEDVVRVSGSTWIGKPPRDFRYGDTRDYEEVPSYSGTWEGMGVLVEALTVRGHSIDLHQDSDFGSRCTIDKVMERAETLPRAASLAAYRALTGKEWKG